MTNNGGDLFVLTGAAGYVYNVASNSWRLFSNPNFAIDAWALTAVDPATGIIYFPNAGMDWSGKDVVLALDLNGGKVSTSGVPAIDTDVPQACAWSVSLKGMLVFSGVFDPTIMNPAKMNTASKGWSVLATAGVDGTPNWNCAVPAYGGTKIALFGNDFQKGVVHVFDSAKRTYTKGVAAPSIIRDSACAVTGDQFIIWGGMVNEKPTDTILIFNMKTNKWITSYTAPPRNTTATTTTLVSLTSGPSQTSSVPSPSGTQQPNAHSSSGETKLVTIIVIVVVVLMAFILGLIFAFFRRTKRSNSGDQDPNGSSTALSDLRSGVTVAVKDEAGLRSSRLRAPVDSGPITTQTCVGPVKDQKWYNFEDGARSPPEHPHAVLKEDLMSLRTAQEGVVEVMAPPQHPHAMIDKNSNTTHSVINEWNRGDKHEWDEDH
ncbi:hypothetical protein BGX34_002557 [Mortierella sp. NVP85]|nr:hypothetical protein BGX34_002557 [Mortierella sp. NVP85]